MTITPSSAGLVVDKPNGRLVVESFADVLDFVGTPDERKAVTDAWEALPKRKQSRKARLGEAPAELAVLVEIVTTGRVRDRRQASRVVKFQRAGLVKVAMYGRGLRLVPTDEGRAVLERCGVVL